MIQNERISREAGFQRFAEDFRQKSRVSTCTMWHKKRSSGGMQCTCWNLINALLFFRFTTR